MRRKTKGAQALEAQGLSRAALRRTAVEPRNTGMARLPRPAAWLHKTNKGESQ